MFWTTVILVETIFQRVTATETDTFNRVISIIRIVFLLLFLLDYDTVRSIIL